MKPIILIIEGVDLSGKSTLMNTLCKAFPGIVFKITDRPRNDSYSERGKIKHYYTSILEYINHNRNKIIMLDRFYPSELVYSKVKRGYEAFGEADFNDYERVINNLDHLVIYCNPGIETILTRLKSRGDDYINEEDIKALMGRYERFSKETRLNTLEIDTNKPVEELLEIIKATIDEYQRNK